MSKHRIAIKLQTPRTREEAADIMAMLKDTALTLQDAQTEMGQKIADIQRCYVPIVERLTREMNQLTGELQRWADANPNEFPGLRGKGAKSLEFLHGTIGYFGTEEFIDRAKIIKDRESIGTEKLASVGVKIEQAETFFAEPTLEQVQPRQVREAA